MRRLSWATLARLQRLTKPPSQTNHVRYSDWHVQDSRRQPCCKIPVCIPLEHTFRRTGETSGSPQKPAHHTPCGFSTLKPHLPPTLHGISLRRQRTILCAGWISRGACCASRLIKCRLRLVVCFLTHEQQGDFARAISTRASDILGPICRHRISQVLKSVVRQASRARRPGLTVAAICVFCSGVYTVRRCHHVDEDHGGL